MKVFLYGFTALTLLTVTACKKKGCMDPTAMNYSESAKKEDGSCHYATGYVTPSTYVFADNGGHSTVDCSAQAARIEQMKQLIAYVKTGKTSVIAAQNMQDMFENTGGNGAGQFTGIAANADVQLKDQCFTAAVSLIEGFFAGAAQASNSYATPAANGQAGTLSSGTSVYLFSGTGMQYDELIEKTLMGALLEYQASTINFGDAEMSGDNTTAVDAANGKYYTEMAHSWDEAFGYFGVPTDFPTTAATSFWGKYCNSQNVNLSSNSVMMNNFLKGRAAIANGAIADRDAAILQIRLMWENIAAYQAMTYLTNAIGFFGNDQAKFLHNLSEAYGFIQTLRYAPDATRRMTAQQIDDLTAGFGSNFWTLTVQDLQDIKATLDATY